MALSQHLTKGNSQQTAQLQAPSGIRNHDLCLTKASKGDLLQFKDYLITEKGLSERTAQDRLDALKRFNEFSNGLFSESIVKMFLRDVLKKGKTPASYNNYIKVFRHFTTYLKLDFNLQYLPIPPAKLSPLPSLNQIKQGFHALQKPLFKSVFAFYFSTGLRKSEVLDLTLDKLDWGNRAVVPNHNTRTKRSGITFFSEECGHLLKGYLSTRTDGLLFNISDRQFRKLWRNASSAATVAISPQILRKFHAVELRLRGVADSFIDIFQGRAPRSVLARHYTPVGVEQLKTVYDKANLSLGT